MGPRPRLSGPVLATVDCELSGAGCLKSRLATPKRARSFRCSATDGYVVTGHDEPDQLRTLDSGLPLTLGAPSPKVRTPCRRAALLALGFRLSSSPPCVGTL